MCDRNASLPRAWVDRRLRSAAPATDEVASSRKAFLAALNPGTAERDAVLAMLRKVVWRTSKICVRAASHPAPVSHVIGCTLVGGARVGGAGCATSWGSEAAELPAPPLGVPELPPVPPTAAPASPCRRGLCHGRRSATADAADSSATADAADASATADIPLAIHRRRRLHPQARATV